MQSSKKYNDIKFFLIAIAFISAFNYYLTWNNIRLNWYLVFTYLNDTIQGWAAWWVMRSIIIWLDKKIPYGEKPLRRILIQILLTTLAGMAVIITLTEVSAWVVKGRAAPLSFYLFDVFIIVVWMLVINGVYIGMHYYHEWKQAEKNRLEDKKIRSEGFIVKQGKENLLIPFSEIFGFYTDGGYSILLTYQDKKYFLDKSLDKIEELLPQEFFFRLNRQHIVHRKALTGFKRTGDGKIDVMVGSSVNFPAAVQVSRTKAVKFKTWFDPNGEEK